MESGRAEFGDRPGSARGDQGREGSFGQNPSSASGLHASSSPEGEPPHKRQRQGPGAEQIAQQPSLSSQTIQPGQRQGLPAGFPADSLFRCQRVMELMLQHPYVSHFNQALGQPNLQTIYGWLQDPKALDPNVKSPADVWLLLRRLFQQFDKACPQEHPLKRICAAIEQHFTACWKHAGLEVFIIQFSNGQTQPMQPQAAPANLLGEANIRTQTNIPPSETKAQEGQQTNHSKQPDSLPQSAPTGQHVARSNSPVVTLPERGQAVTGLLQQREQPAQGLGNSMTSRPGAIAQSVPSSTFGLGNPPSLSVGGSVALADTFKSNARPQGQGVHPASVATQGFGRQVAGPERPQMPRESSQLDPKLMLSLSPLEQNVLRQADMLRNLRQQFALRAHAAQMAFVQYQQYEQQLQGYKAKLDEAKRMFIPSQEAQPANVEAPKGEEDKSITSTKTEPEQSLASKVQSIPTVTPSVVPPVNTASRAPSP